MTEQNLRSCVACNVKPEGAAIREQLRHLTFHFPEQHTGTRCRDNSVDALSVDSLLHHSFRTSNGRPVTRKLMTPVTIPDIIDLSAMWGLVSLGALDTSPTSLWCTRTQVPLPGTTFCISVLPTLWLLHPRAVQTRKIHGCPRCEARECSNGP